MPLSLTYATLKAEMQQFQGDTGAAFVAELDTLIQSAETRLLRELDLTIFDVTVDNIAFVQGNPSVAKPTGFLATRVLSYLSGTVHTQLLPRTAEFIEDYAPDSAVTATPKYYCDLDDANWKVAAAPAVSNANCRCKYVKRPAGLSASVGSTWLSANVADLLLHASLVETCRWAKNTPRQADWEAVYQKDLSAARHELQSLIHRN